MPKQRKRPSHMGGKVLHSSYRGITYEHGRKKPWKAYVIRNGKQCNLGRFADESSARDARAAALKD
jgi:hypothetical protein